MNEQAHAIHVSGVNDTSNMRSTSEATRGPLPSQRLGGYCPDCGNHGRVHGPVQDVFGGALRDCWHKGWDLTKWSPESIDAMLRQEAQ